MGAYTPIPQGLVHLPRENAPPHADALPPGIGRVLLSADAIERRVRELAREISDEYAGRDVVLIGVLRGAVCFMSDLMRALALPAEVEVMAVSSYSGRGGSGVKIAKDIDTDVTGRHVIIVEDIVDTGLTLDFLLKYLRLKHPASLEVCALLDKKSRRDNPGAGAMGRLRDTQRVRSRLRPGLPGPVPQSAVYSSC